MHHLKKYPNRRLYNTTESKYVTIEDVRKLIIKGESISVADSRDGTDITRSVLLQILSDQEAQGHEPVLTNRAIEQIIRFYGDELGGEVSKYIEQGILSYLEHQEQFVRQLRKLGQMNPLNVMRDALESSFKDFPFANNPPGSRQSPTTKPSGPHDVDAPPPERERD